MASSGAALEMPTADTRRMINRAGYAFRRMLKSSKNSSDVLNRCEITEKNVKKMQQELTMTQRALVTTSERLDVCNEKVSDCQENVDQKLEEVTNTMDRAVEQFENSMSKMMTKVFVMMEKMGERSINLKAAGQSSQENVAVKFRELRVMTRETMMLLISTAQSTEKRIHSVENEVKELIHDGEIAEWESERHFVAIKKKLAALESNVSAIREGGYE